MCLLWGRVRIYDLDNRLRVANAHFFIGDHAAVKEAWAAMRIVQRMRVECVDARDDGALALRVVCCCRAAAYARQCYARAAHTARVRPHETCVPEVDLEVAQKVQMRIHRRRFQHAVSIHA